MLMEEPCVFVGRFFRVSKEFVSIFMEDSCVFVSSFFRVCKEFV